MSNSKPVRFLTIDPHDVSEDGSMPFDARGGNTPTVSFIATVTMDLELFEHYCQARHQFKLPPLAYANTPTNDDLAF